MILNGTLVQQRRRDLGLSHRSLAKHLDVSGSVIAGIENGTNHATLTVGFLVKLASALGVDVTVLHQNSRGPVGTRDDSDLVARLGALLVTVDSLIAVDALAEALGVTLERIETGLTQLGRQLKPAGLTVHRLARDVALRADAVTNPKEVKTLLRKHLARRGMNLTEARVLARTLAGTLDEGKLGNAETVALNHLRVAGIISTATPPHVTDDVVTGLLLDET